MNLFQPYEDVADCAQALDDRRLIKQILECKQIYDSGIQKRGYSNHPVTQHFKRYPFYVVRYALACCYEYYHRFGKRHSYEDFFIDKFDELLHNATDADFKTPFFYAQYSISNPMCIRTIENVPELFQKKLIDKWSHDRRPPRWTRRDAPDFWIRSNYFQALCQLESASIVDDVTQSKL